MKDKRVVRIIISAVVLMVVGIIAYAYFAISGNSSSLKAERYEIPSREHVFINGVYKPDVTRVFETNQAKGVIDSIGVTNGAAVTAGQPIITYRNEEATNQITEIGHDIETLRKGKNNDYNQRKKAQDQKVQSRNSMISQAKKMGEPVDYSQLPSTELDPPSMDYDDQIAKQQRQLENLRAKQYKTEFSDISGVATVENFTGADGSKETRIIVRSSNYLVEGSVKEKDVNKISKGMEGESLIVANDKKIKSKIEEVSDKPVSSETSGIAQAGAAIQNPQAAAAGSSGTASSDYKVMVSLSEADESLKEGFHIQTKVEVGDYVVKIPTTALIKEGDNRFVFVIKDDNTLEKRKINVKKEGKEETTIQSGLKEREEIVSNPNEKMKEGDRIE